MFAESGIEHPFDGAPGEFDLYFVSVKDRALLAVNVRDPSEIDLEHFVSGIQKRPTFLPSHEHGVGWDLFGQFLGCFGGHAHANVVRKHRFGAQGDIFPVDESFRDRSGNFLGFFVPGHSPSLPLSFVNVIALDT